jgi:hypothetical protein
MLHDVIIILLIGTAVGKTETHLNCLLIAYLLLYFVIW